MTSPTNPRPADPPRGTFSAAWIDEAGRLNYTIPFGTRAEAEAQRDIQRRRGHEAWIAEW
jgi:hypothetical protein